MTGKGVMKMKENKKMNLGIAGIIAMGLVLTCVLLFPTAPPSEAATVPKIYKMEGTISAIDLKFNTVVVNVPLTEKKIFKVGGPLAKDATLKKGDNTNLTLKDFKVGDKVIVEWEPTSQGHLIKSLEGR